MPSTLSPFEEIEALINEGVEQHLSNATATHNGGPAFPVQFDSEGVAPYGDAEVDATGFLVGYRAVHAPGLRRGGLLSIRGVEYRVESDAQPDASGWVQANLIKA